MIFEWHTTNFGIIWSCWLKEFSKNSQFFSVGYLDGFKENSQFLHNFWGVCPQTGRDIQTQWFTVTILDSDLNSAHMEIVAHFVYCKSDGRSEDPKGMVTFHDRSFETL